MMSNILDKYAVILLDMNSTFMFDEDRFGESEDFFATYLQLGGARLDRMAVNDAIRKCYDGMREDYESRSKIDDFPSVAEGLLRYANVDGVDVPLLEEVFTRHEKGAVPTEFADCLRRLSRTHKLGLVSNIWARKESWLQEFEKVGIRDIWSSMVFSSDGRSVKPSSTLFLQAVDDFSDPPSRMVFVGDSLRADIVPAKILGLDTIWINSDQKAHTHADYVISSLLQLDAGIDETRR